MDHQSLYNIATGVLEEEKYRKDTQKPEQYARVNGLMDD